jgi:D-beta-D-heptose 7-phosphate kinase/D-beta-D-heptose 1-phosphate adenosyltransferase
VGHVRLLEQAAALGDYLVVGVNSDASVQRLKGPKRPLNSAEARAEVLSALGTVNAVTVFDAETPIDLISAIRPNVLVKGGDYLSEQVVGRREVEAAGGRLVLVPLFPGHSTTSLLNRAVERELTPHAAEPVRPPHRARAASASRTHDARS